MKHPTNKCESCGYKDVNANPKHPEPNCPSCGADYDESHERAIKGAEDRQVTGKEDRKEDE